MSSVINLGNLGPFRSGWREDQSGPQCIEQAMQGSGF